MTSQTNRRMDVATRARLIIGGLLGTAALLVAACSSDQGPTASTAGTPPAQTTPSAPAPPSAQAPTTARYRVTFEATWSAPTHPQDFPSGAHFSGLIGGTHNASVTFWQEGALATDGIKNMSELGSKTPLDQEVTTAIASGTAEHLLSGGGIALSPGSVTLEFEITQAYPLVTLVSMIAPSPDWFVGVSRLPLFENGQWADERRIDLVPWDAGTDSGVTFTSPDLATIPRQPISRILSAPLSPAGRVTPMGTFRFTRLAG